MSALLLALLLPAATPATWDVLGGRVPSGDLLEVRAGFSALPSLAWHHAIADGLSIGGFAAFDYAYSAPDASFSPAILLGVPIRLSLAANPDFALGLRFMPGVDFDLPKSGFRFGVLLHAGASFGIPIGERYTLGAGVDLPAALIFGGGTTALRLPILVGPEIELRATERLALTFAAKLGPWIGAGAGSATLFGLQATAGLGYRL